MTVLLSIGPPNFGVKLMRPGFGPAAELPTSRQRDGVTAVAVATRFFERHWRQPPRRLGFRHAGPAAQLTPRCVRRSETRSPGIARVNKQLPAGDCLYGLQIATTGRERHSRRLSSDMRWRDAWWLLREAFVEMPRADRETWNKLLGEFDTMMQPHLVRLAAKICHADVLDAARLTAAAYRCTNEAPSTIRDYLTAPNDDMEPVADIEFLPRSASPRDDGETCQTGRIGFVARRGRTTVVALRGTEDWLDWLLNGQGSVLMTSNNSNSTYNLLGIEMADRVLKYIERHDSGDAVLLSGHSMGGGVAIMTEAVLTFMRGDLVSPRTITFGAPPVGWPYPSVEPNLYRVQKATDVVPYVLDKPFHHVGHECLLTEDGDLVEMDGSLATSLLILGSIAKANVRHRGVDDVGAKYLLYRGLRMAEGKDLNKRATLKVNPSHGHSLPTAYEHSMASYVETLTRKPQNRRRLTSV